MNEGFRIVEHVYCICASKVSVSYVSPTVIEVLIALDILAKDTVVIDSPYVRYECVCVRVCVCSCADGGQMALWVSVSAGSLLPAGLYSSFSQGIA